MNGLAHGARKVLLDVCLMRDVRGDLLEHGEMEREAIAQLPKHLEVIEHPVSDVGLQRLGCEVGKALDLKGDRIGCVRSYLLGGLIRRDIGKLWAPQNSIVAPGGGFCASAFTFFAGGFSTDVRAMGTAARSICL